MAQGRSPGSYGKQEGGASRAGSQLKCRGSVGGVPQPGSAPGMVGGAAVQQREVEQQREECEIKLKVGFFLCKQHKDGERQSSHDREL